MAAAASEGDGLAGQKPFNVQPCLRDPVFHLLKDRLRLSPAAGGGLFLVLYLGGNVLFSWLGGALVPRRGLDVAFTQDAVAWVLYGFLVPVGTMLALRFYYQVDWAFERIFGDGVIRVSLDEYNVFLRRLNRWYNSGRLHIAALGLALVVFGYLIYIEEADPSHSWTDLDAGIGAIYHAVLGLIAWYSALLVLLKVAVTVWALRRVFQWRVNIQPLHPDGCGGFGLFTAIAVTIALFTAIMATAVALFIVSGTLLHGTSITAGPVLVAALLEMMTLVVFFGCLYSAHRAMREAKQALLRCLHERFQEPFSALQLRLERGEGCDETAEEITRLETLHGIVRRLPVWPTNTQMLAQVGVSVAVPLALLVLQVGLDKLLGKN